MDLKIVTVFGFFLLKLYRRTEAMQVRCGFPGTPAFGYAKPDSDFYSAGDIVTYSCRVGYILLGSPIRRCKDDGFWTEQIPICDDSMTTLGFASSTPTIPGHPAEMAIDRDKDTCTYMQPKKTRWWRIDLGGDYKVLSVAVTMTDTDKFTKFTVFVIRIQGTSASYKRCASFTGKFGTPTIVLSCAEGRGIQGQRVHIEDHLQTEGVFEVCEVEVQVEKDTGYECGRPERNPYSITFDVEGNQVEYGCLMGYQLEGRQVRTCLTSGQWTGEPPICEAIVCEPLQSLANGDLKLSVINGETPLEGTVVNYICDDGYSLLGDFNRICLKDGSWSGKQPHCEAVRCPLPDATELGGVYRLVNKTTRMGSMALLKCRKGKMDGTNPYIICTEEGDWTDPQSRCLIPPGAATGMAEGPKIVKKEAILFGMVVAGIMMAIVLASLYIITQKRRRMNKPALPLRQIEAPEAPPRPPPRSRNLLASTILECVTGDTETLHDYELVQKETDTLLKTQSLPLEQSESKNDISPNRVTTSEKPFQEHFDEDHHHPRLSPQRETQSEDIKSEFDENVGGTEVEEKSAHTKSDTEDKENAHTLQQEEKVYGNLSGSTAGREYAEVDFEKKRQSRLQKELSSEMADENQQENSKSSDKNEITTPPILPPRKSESVMDEKIRTNNETAGTESANLAPEIEDQPKVDCFEDPESSQGLKRTRAAANVDMCEEEKEPREEEKVRKPRRMRAQVELAAKPEDKPATRELRRSRVRE